MQNDLSFIVDFKFKELNYEQDARSWQFVFSNRFVVVTSGFWRLLKDDKILLVSLDHLHQFGLPKPVDLKEEVERRLIVEALTEVFIDKFTGDLTLIFTNQFTLKIYISSRGYETYDFTINHKRYIGLGSGNIDVIEIN